MGLVSAAAQLDPGLPAAQSGCRLDHPASRGAANASVQADPPITECSFALLSMLSLQILKGECISAKNFG